MTYEKAMTSSKKILWKLKIEEELDFIERNNTWTHAVSMQGKDALQCTALLNQNLDERGFIACNKARLVVKGYIQKDVLTRTRGLRLLYHSKCCFSLSKRLYQWVGMVILLTFALIP